MDKAFTAAAALLAATFILAISLGSPENAGEVIAEITTEGVR
jgi:hypothetical protein